MTVCFFGTGRRKPGRRNSSGISGRSGSRMCIFRNTISTIACSCVKHCKTQTNRRKTMWELYEKSTEKLELNRVLELLADCAGSEDGKAACRAFALQRSGGGPGASGANHGGLHYVCCAGFSRLYDVKNVDALERADRGGEPLYHGAFADCRGTTRPPERSRAIGARRRPPRYSPRCSKR